MKFGKRRVDGGVPGRAKQSSARAGITAVALVVVAEGVETQVQRDYLTNKGCSQLQGYLFSKPIEADQLAAWAKAQTPSAIALRSVA